MCSFLKNGIDVPEYITEDFVQKSLEHGLRTPVSIERISFTTRSVLGENYASDLFRLCVKYSRNIGTSSEEVSLIIKCMKDEIEKEIPSKEILMYTEIIPELENLFPNRDVIFSPKCYYTTTEPMLTFVFEDLNAVGFKLEDRVQGLNEAHSRALMKKMGKFHAASMCLIKKKPDLFEKLKVPLFTENLKTSTTFIEAWLGNIPFIADLVEPWPGFENIAKKLRNVRENLYETLISLTKPSAINVLNHGDLWVNNFLYKYEKDDPVDVSFIDLQISVFGSPGIDIHYFLNTSPQLEVLKTKRYELLQEYYKSLKSTLELLQYNEIPTWEDIKDEVRKTEIYGFWAMESIFPFVTLSKDSSKDNRLDLFTDPNAALQKRKAMFSSIRTSETVKYSLFRFDELGVLD